MSKKNFFSMVGHNLTTKPIKSFKENFPIIISAIIVLGIIAGCVGVLFLFVSLIEWYGWWAAPMIALIVFVGNAVVDAVLEYKEAGR